MRAELKCPNSFKCWQNFFGKHERQRSSLKTTHEKVRLRSIKMADERLVKMQLNECNFSIFASVLPTRLLLDFRDMSKS